MVASRVTELSNLTEDPQCTLQMRKVQLPPDVIPLLTGFQFLRSALRKPIVKYTYQVATSNVQTLLDPDFAQDLLVILHCR